VPEAHAEPRHRIPRRLAAALARGAAPLALGLAAALAGCGPAAPARPNLVLLTVDTLRPDRLACYGGDDRVGTGICGLASRGVRFTWALSAAPSTAPSVASILTSLPPSAHGVAQRASTVLAPRQTSVAELLAAAGYRTAAFVCNPVLRRERGLAQGFEIYDQRMTRRERNRPALRERSAEDATDAALAWARVARPPWFLWVHYQDPHGPYDPPGTAPGPEVPGAAPLPLLRDNSGYRGIPAYQALPGLRSAAAYARQYRAEIRYLDLHLARLVAGLDGLGRPPFVLLTADHGEAFGEDGYYFAHGHSVGLDQIRVPLLVRPIAPGAPRAVSVPVSTLDVAPTLLAAAGLAVPAAFWGQALPLDGAGARDPRVRPILSEHRFRAAVVLGRRYFARDRPGFANPRRDVISGGWLRPLPARTAVLERNGETPSYVNVGPSGSALLERALARALAEASRGAGAPAPVAPLTPQDREALRALGYLD